MPTLFIRAPFESGASSTTAPFTAAEDPTATGSLTVTIEPTDVSRLNLLPAFAGRLTFKPTAPLEGNRPIIGNLYLELAPAALKELAALLPDLNYPLLLIYYDVLLSDAFFTGTVESAPVSSAQPNVRIATGDQKKDAFKRGWLSVNIAPNRTTPNCKLPVVRKNAADQHTITLQLGVRMTADPFVQSADLPLRTLAPLDIIDPSSFLPVPLAYFFKALRGLPDNKWTAASADGHKTHPFYDALDQLEQAAPPAPSARWRRLRVFTSTESKAPPGSFSAAAGDVTVHAGNSGGELWSRGLNALGEIFIRRPDNEIFTVEVKQTPPPSYPPPSSPPATAPAPAVCKVAPWPIGTAVNSLARSWSPPTSAGNLAPKIEIRAEINFDGDPLLNPLIKLEEGLEDFRGLTVVSPTSRTLGRVIARRHLILPLQKRLASFGFGTTHTPSRAFKVAVRHAVREFQREARMATVNGQATRVSGGVPVAATAITLFTGEINGTADLPTLTEMRFWKDRNYRAAISFDIRRTGHGSTTAVKDVGYADANSFGWSVVVAPARRFAHSMRYMDDKTGQYFYGAVNVNGPQDIARGRRPLDELSDLARTAQYAYLKTWEKRVILAVIDNESKIFEAVNTYDGAFLTAGAVQWTAGTESAKGELPGILSTMGEADFARLFGVWGLGTTDIQGRPFVDVIAGRFKLDGETLTTPGQKDELRAFRWVYRFAEAAKDNVYRELQIRQAHTRIGAMRRTPLQWGGKRITAESLLQSELMCALALDEHVNAGGGGLRNVLQHLSNGLCTPAKIITINVDGTFGGEWYERQRKSELNKALKAKAKREKVNVRSVTLTPEEVAAIDLLLVPIVKELLLLRYQCEDPTTTPADLVMFLVMMGLGPTLAFVTQVNTAALTVTGGELSPMNMEQHLAASALCLWLRAHVSQMNHPTDRWDNMVRGGYAGVFGDPSNAPGVFTP